MILRVPFFSRADCAAGFIAERSGVFRSDDIVGHLWLDGVPSYALVSLEEAHYSFNSDLRANNKLRAGSNIGEVRSLEADVDKDLLMLWMSSHAAFRAWQAQLGEGGHVAESLIAVEAAVAESSGLAGIMAALSGVELSDGDVVVIADKCVSFAFGRIFPREFMGGQDPKFLLPDERRDFAHMLSKRLGYPLSERQLLCIDYVPTDRASVSIGNHNKLCNEISQAIQRDHARTVDVVISDSDTGLDYGFPLIGGATVGCSPLGATAGLTPYEAIRVSAAAEIRRGHARRIPIVICKTNARNARRPSTGLCRRYEDSFDLSREVFIHHGLKNTYYWKRCNHESRSL